MFDKIQFRTSGWKKFFLFSTCIHWIAIVRRRSPWKGFQRSFLSLQRELRRPMYSFLRFTVRDGNKYKVNRLKNCSFLGWTWNGQIVKSKINHFPSLRSRNHCFKWHLLRTRRYWDISRVVWLMLLWKNWIHKFSSLMFLERYGL